MVASNVPTGSRNLYFNIFYCHEYIFSACNVKMAASTVVSDSEPQGALCTTLSEARYNQSFVWQWLWEWVCVLSDIILHGGWLIPLHPAISVVNGQLFYKPPRGSDNQGRVCGRVWRLTPTCNVSQWQRKKNKTRGVKLWWRKQRHGI